MRPEKNNHNKDHLDLLFSITELTDLVTESTDIESFLQKAVDLVARHLNVPVCSIYLFDEREKKLILKATRGLRPSAVNRIRMAPGQGLVGTSFETGKIICESDVRQSDRFKYFAEAGEDAFNSFLCLPVQQRLKNIGVMVVQHQNVDYFTQTDQNAIRTVASQLANAMDNASLLMAISQGQAHLYAPEPAGFIKGVCASPGVGCGRAKVLKNNKKKILIFCKTVHHHHTKAHLKTAIEKTLQQLRQLQADFAQLLPESASLIFTSHFMILKDKNFSGKMVDLVDEGTDPGEAVRKVAHKYISIFSSSPNPHLREKRLDVEDLATRILENLDESDSENNFRKDAIIVAEQIYPTDVLKLFSHNIKGIVLSSGGVTSHVSILARSLKIPLIITDKEQLQNLKPDTVLLMDAEQGNIYIDPDPETIRLFDSQTKLDDQSDRLDVQKGSITRDKVPVTVMVNINLLNEVRTARELGAQGIGLYRTEFPFFIRSTFPSEAEQYVIYKRLFKGFGGSGPVTIRTLDAGGEKNLTYSQNLNEQNPELGLRSIRFSLKYKKIFRDQIKAILRAAYSRNRVRIMFPLVSSLDDFLAAKAVVYQCKEELKKEQSRFNDNVAIGMMVEVPSVLETICDFAREADFFSIGTNDFVQYMLAADRSNKRVAGYYNPVHPAVTRGIDRIVTAARSHDIEVSVCGEAAHEPSFTAFLIGLGVRHLSVDPGRLADTRRTIRSIDTTASEKFAQKLLSQSTVSDAQSVFRAWQHRRPDIANP